MDESRKQSFRALAPEEIVRTVDALGERIDAAFPGSSLSGIASELGRVSREVRELADWLARPLVWARVLVGIGIVLLFAALIGALLRLHVDLRVKELAELLQGVEAGVNNVVFLGIGLYFLWMLEARLKRARALKSLHMLRSLAHIIDLHQLKKDPESVSGGDRGGAELSPRELARYLDHCGDMLTLIGKLAALHAQEFSDGPTLAVVQEVEDLSQGLVRNIWQKIAIVDRVHAS